jgi:hypothetical protein
MLPTGVLYFDGVNAYYGRAIESGPQSTPAPAS